MNVKLFLIVTISLIIGVQAARAGCPDLRGEYVCPVDATTVRDVIVTQKMTSEFTQYTFGDRSGAEDIFFANAAGIRDEFGWTTRCTNENRLESFSDNAGTTAEIYLSPNGSLIRTYAGNIVSVCSRQ